MSASIKSQPTIGLITATETVPDDARRTWEGIFAGPMFFLSVLFLVVLAGLIHRFPRLESGDPEMVLIEGALAGVWLIFVFEAVLRFQLRNPERSIWKPLGAAVACVLIPPMRMGLPSQIRPNHLWLPGLGWREIDCSLRKTLERVFSVPMIFFALMVLPLLALEYFQQERIRSEPVLALWVDIGTSIIWLAFAIELIIMVAVSERGWRYCAAHWIDVIIVLLPAVEMLPVLRLLRVGRILRLEQLLRWGRLHRLNALVTRGWRAFLVLQIVHRVTGHTLEGRLKQSLELLQAREEEVAELRREIEELEKRIAERTSKRETAVASSAR
jgi:voltage-gated potassium channel